MNIADLKKIGMANSKLSKININTTKQMLSEFSDDPEVAKAIGYMNQFQEELPENHPIFKYVENLKKQKDNVELSKNIVNKKKDQEIKTEKERKETEEKQNEIKEQLNEMLKKLEVENDKIFEFLSKNQKSFYGNQTLVVNLMKTRRFLISTKNGFKDAKMR